MVTGSDKSANNAHMLSVGKPLRDCCSTQTSLAGTRWVHSNVLAPGTLSLVRKRSKKTTPPHVMNRLGEHTVSQAFNVECLYGNGSVLLNETVGQLVLKILPLIRHMLVNLRKDLNGLMTTIGTFLPSCYSTLRYPQSSLCLAIPTWILNRRTIGQDSEGFQINVYADSCVRPPQRLRFYCARKASIPSAAYPLEKQRAYCLRQWTVQFDFHVADLGDSNTLALNLESIWGEHERVEAVAPFESWKPRRLSLSYTAKEILEGAMEPNQNSLQGVSVNVLEFGSHFLDGRQLCLLVEPTHRRTVLVGIYPFL